MTQSLPKGGVISGVDANSWASRYGLKPGDRVIAVDGQLLNDIIDFSFAVADDEFVLEYVNEVGILKQIQIRKRQNEGAGIEFTSAVFDYIKLCANKCAFCFVDQMPQGLRESLYIKDDDYRLSFLQGSFITLTNLTTNDKERIKRLHLSPLYVSVHASDDDVRRALLGLSYNAEIMTTLRDLATAGIDFHCQIVLCPNINDGEVLRKTISDLLTLQENLLSLAIVPVGLTKFSKKLDYLTPVDNQYAKSIITIMRDWLLNWQKEYTCVPVYLADEFYLRAGDGVPAADYYDEYPQWENGVGIVRSFTDEWQTKELCEQGYRVINGAEKYTTECYALCGSLVAPYISQLLIEEFPAVKVVAVDNMFFGNSVTVSGLLTGTDIIAWAKNIMLPVGSTLLLPKVAARRDNCFLLDGWSVDKLAKHLQVVIVIVDGAGGLRSFLTGSGIY